MEIREFIKTHPRAVLAFSGGVDSSYLLYVGIQAGADWRPVFLHSAFQPTFELEDAKRLCHDVGAELTVLEIDILEIPKVRQNPENRCYYCKTALFGKLKTWASEQGIDCVLDGSNASDPVTDRPGMRAAAELGVLSPLREAGLTKAEIRCLSREAGLFTWNKPAYACLATRIQTGTALDADTLQRVEAGESALRDLGFTDLRIRVFHGAGRVQLPAEELPGAIRERERILSALKSLFPAVLLDLEARQTDTDTVQKEEGKG